MNFVLKTLVSAVIISIVTLVSKQMPKYGGVIAALPLVSLLSLFWLYFQGESTINLSRFLFGVLYGLPGTVLLIFIVAICLKNSVPILVSILLGVGGWMIVLKIQSLITDHFQQLTS
jgi:hypothetical protein